VELSLEQKVGQRILLAFEGKQELSREVREAIPKYKPAGVTLFRSLNISQPQQVKQLTELLQDAARRAELARLLIAVDQEGGQLMAIGEGTTALPGNMALGAIGSADLAWRAGSVLGLELAAMGINVNYAPCVDVNNNPKNPVIGLRSFGEDPQAVSNLAAAMVGGIQSAGVAATAKHFPGHGDTTGDSHEGLPRVMHGLDRLLEVEFPPFESAIKAGTKLIMTAHLALPSLDGPEAPPATLSRAVLTGLLRRRLGFEGVIVTDAMDMHAISQGQMLGDSALRAAAAGADLLLLTANPRDQALVHSSLLTAARVGAMPAGELNGSATRIRELKRWLADRSVAVDISRVGCSEHQAVANEIATRSVTLVRSQAGKLPLRLDASQRMAVIVPKPRDLTPADTSSYVVPTLAAALRLYHPNIEEFVIPYDPTAPDIGSLLERVRQYNLVVFGTINASEGSGQATLVREIVKSGPPIVVIGMRLPYELRYFPNLETYVCAYSILEPSMHAVAAALFGRNEFQGKLPVSIPGLYALGHGESL
jgi:beta-N-acetylhexosaminidase